MTNAQDYLTNVALILTVMGAAVLLEAAVPLFARPARPPGRRRANLAMTAQTLLFAFVLTSAVAAAALALPLTSPALMAAAGLPAAAQLAFGIVVLDFAYGYVAHRTMHASPLLWKFHRIHHSDAFVDVTTSFRTHPVEIAWRHLWLFATVWALGVPAAAVAAFRVLSAVNGILEHANVRLKPALDAALSWVWVTPQMHKVHHSRDPRETDTNYGNLLALHDRLLGTFVRTERAFSVTYGLDDVDPAERQSLGALLAMPWRPASGRGRPDPAAARPELVAGSAASTTIGTEPGSYDAGSSNWRAAT
jgi:sterol desaturase/sphingolipid hydroxylase (fatty acid hydroxylase superfamily)